jgi:NAD(P)-dependent dehydrogenase (short-subunit alcohol dehydrogenase family)
MQVLIRTGRDAAVNDGAASIGGVGMRMTGKVALISGAAGGMGAATARLFAAEGAKAVIVADILDQEGKAVVAEIEKAGGRASFVHLDVTDEAQWKAAVDGIVAAHGGLDVLVNNAGISGSAEADLYDTAAWNRLMGINATGVFLGMKYATAVMKKAGRGSIVNLSSISGIVGQGYIHVGYNASKGAVRLITKAGAAQHGKDGIRVNSVHPGLMPPMRTSGRTADPVMRAKTLKGVPMGRAGEVDEVARAILFLASDESSYVTGAELVVDGGWTAV